MKLKPITNVAFGSDAELFLKDLTGRPFPVCGIVGGTKENPKPLAKKGFFIQEDNVMPEFNIPVCRTAEEFSRAFDDAIGLVRDVIPPTFNLCAEGSMHFDEALLQTSQAQVFGCSPDFNAWTVEINDIPSRADSTLRTAAAHVHISWDNPDDDQRIELVKTADVFVSIPELKHSPDRERRKMYGRAGAHRPKPYGIEHRVLDNSWIGTRVKSTFNNYLSAIKFLNSGFLIDVKDYDLIQKCINEYDYELGSKITEKYKAMIEPTKAETKKAPKKFIDLNPLYGF